MSLTFKPQKVQLKFENQYKSDVLGNELKERGLGMKDILIYVIAMFLVGVIVGTVSYKWFSVNERIRKLENKLNELEKVNE